MTFIFDIPYLVMGLVSGGFYSLVVLGFSLGWSVAKMPDISYIMFVYLAGEITAVFNRMFGIEPILLSPLIASLFFGLGVFMYKTFISFLHRKVPEPGLAGLTLTFGLGIILENLMIIIFTPDFRSATSTYVLRVGGMTLTIYHVLTLPIAMVVSLLLYFLIFKTKWGILLRASVQEPIGAAICGIESEKLRMITYGIAYTIGGFAGTLLPVLQYVQPSASWGIMPISFITAILGGVGSIVGTLVIGNIIGLIVSYSSALLPAAWISTELFLILVIILLVRPRGLFRGLS
jgi:branched-chain amino acid transport system permease protein